MSEGLALCKNCRHFTPFTDISNAGECSYWSKLENADMPFIRGIHSYCIQFDFSLAKRLEFLSRIS